MKFSGSSLLAVLFLFSVGLAQEERLQWDTLLLDGYVYVATGEGVMVLDQSLVQVGMVSGFPAYALLAWQDHLLAASDYGLYVLGLDNPRSPEVVGVARDLLGRTLAPFGPLVLMGGGAGLAALDLADPSSPEVVARMTGLSVWGIATEGDRIYLATNQGLQVVALEEGVFRTLASWGEEPAYAVAAGGGYLFLGTSREVVILEAGEALEEVARLPIERPYRILLQEGMLMVSGLGGFSAYRVVDPSAPVLLVHQAALVYTGFALWETRLVLLAPYTVFLYEFLPPSLTLLASRGQELKAVENPRFSPKTPVHDAFREGNLVYLALETGVRVMEASDPQKPRFIGEVKGFRALTVFVWRGLLYVGTPGGLKVFQIKAPGALEEVAQWSGPPVYALWVGEEGIHLGTAQGLILLRMVERTFTVLARLEGGAVYTLAFWGDRLYAGGLDGLWIVRLGPKPERIRTLGGFVVFHLLLEGEGMYLAGPDGLRVFRLEEEPVLTSFIPGFPALYLSILSEALYVLLDRSLYVFDLSDPWTPGLVRRLEVPQATLLLALPSWVFLYALEGVYALQVEDPFFPLLSGLLASYLAALEKSTPPPPPPKPATGWYGTHWVKTFSGWSGFLFSETVELIAVALDPKGYIYAGGYVGGLDEDIYLVKLDPSGKVLWTKRFGTGSNDGVFGLAVDAKGNLYIAGHTLGSLGGPNRGDWDFFVGKFDPSGKRLFLRQYGTNRWDKVVGVSVSPQGYVYVAGFTYGAFPGHRSMGDRDAFLARLDSSGNLVWVKQYGSRGGEVALSVFADPSGNAYVVGQTDGVLPGQKAYGGDDVFLLKYSPQGQLLWSRQMGTPADDRGQTVAADAQGVYVAGTTQGSFLGGAKGTKAFLIRLDKAGNRVWTREFGVSVVEGEEVITGSAYVGLGPGGRVYLSNSASGNLPGYLGAGREDVFVLEYDSKGNLKGILQTGTPKEDLAYAMAVGRDGKVYVVGSTGEEGFVLKAKTPIGQ
ncbi:MAG: SBBP repeat-containing protein [Thermaceae bacterium]